MGVTNVKYDEGKMMGGKGNGRAMSRYSSARGNVYFFAKEIFIACVGVILKP